MKSKIGKLVVPLTIAATLAFGNAPQTMAQSNMKNDKKTEKTTSNTKKVMTAKEFDRKYGNADGRENCARDEGKIVQVRGKVSYMGSSHFSMDGEYNGRVVFDFGGDAEFAPYAKYLKLGQEVTVEGQIVTTEGGLDNCKIVKW